MPSALDAVNSDADSESTKEPSWWTGGVWKAGALEVRPDMVCYNADASIGTGAGTAEEDASTEESKAEPKQSP